MTAEPFPLTNAHWKAERAKFHLDSLNAEITAFSLNDPHTVTVHDEPERDEVRYRIQLKQPHVSMFLIVGDFLQCLRTALDQAVWSLSFHRTGADRDSSEFPVYASPLNSEGRKKFKGKLEGLTDAAIAYIESLQPYNRPAGTPPSVNPLWCLHELNRIDKHRRISVQPQITIGTRTYFAVGFPDPQTSVASMRQERTDYGYDIICTGTYKNLQPKFTSFIQFGEEKSGVMLAVDGLARLHDIVANEVLPKLAGFA